MRDLPVRKNMRLKGYDYSQDGCYFITVCVKDRHELLWDGRRKVGAAFGRPPISTIGNLIENELLKINEIYDTVKIDKYVIMPNHVHMILRIYGGNGRPKAAPTGGVPSVSSIMNKFKSSISKQLGYSIWQKLFHDHVIRDEDEYQRIWQYIEDNPQIWQEDCYYIE
jgi:REP element-mobilizing transposase RayT